MKSEHKTVPLEGGRAEQSEAEGVPGYDCKDKLQSVRFRTPPSSIAKRLNPPPLSQEEEFEK